MPTDEQRAKARAYMLEKRAEMTPEEVEAHREYHRVYMNKRNAAMTPEERAAFNEAKREYARMRRATESPEQREKRLADARVRSRKRKLERPEAVRESNRRYTESRKAKEVVDPSRRETRLEVSKRLYQSLRKTALVRYSGPVPACACCGEQHTEFLVIDHVGGGGSQHRKNLGASTIYTWLKQKGYPDGFRVLCHNCNFAIRFGDPCPHEREKIVAFKGGCL